jgi:glycosyltransferase involved in cell wall biosynthesis
MLTYTPLKHPTPLTAHHWPEDTRPHVSISCMTYNHARYLPACLDGILNQETVFPVEILVHDDASTDGTTSILKDYVTRYPRLMKPVYQEVNQYSRNVRVAQLYNLPRTLGAYIAICDGDDCWTDTHKLAVQESTLTNDPNVAVCYGSVVAVDANNARVPDYVGGAIRDLTSKELIRGAAINTSTAMIRNIGFFPDRTLLDAPLGDITLWSRLGWFGEGRYLPQISPGIYRVTSQGVWAGQDPLTRKFMAIRTYLALANYYHNRHDHEVAEFFLRSSYHVAGSTIPLSLHDAIQICRLAIRSTLRARR